MFSKLFVNGIRAAPSKRTLPIGQLMIRSISTAEYQTNSTEQSYQSYYTHNPVEGYIRNSPYDTVITPNLALDQYVWQNVSKWQNHVATVS